MTEPPGRVASSGTSRGLVGPELVGPELAGPELVGPELIGAVLGLDLAAAEPTRGHQGQGRTWLATCGADPVVVKWGLDPDLPEKLPYVAAQVPVLRGRGCPVPEIIAHGPLPGGAYGWVQERLPGAPATVLDETLLQDLIQLTGRMAGAPPGPHRSRYSEWVPLVVFADEAGWWRAAAAVSPAAAGICRRLHRWAGRPRDQPPPSHDYVHADLNLGNLMVAAGRLVGLVDTENLGTGDRAIDLARLAFDWHVLDLAGTPGLAPDGRDRLARLGLAISGPAGWRLAIAYEIVSRLGWRSEHGTQTDPAATEVAACAGFLDAMTGLA